MAQTTIVSRIRYCTRGLPSLPARIRSVRQQRSMSTSKKLVPAKALDGLGKNLWVEFSALAAATKAVNLGQVFMRDELEMIADLCKRFDVLCLSDEVYEHLVYSGSEHFRIATLPGMWERTVTIGSGGKTFSATGWKVGWAVGPEHLITPMQTVNSNVGYTMVTPLQEAMAEAFEVEIARLGQPDCYFNQLPRELEKTRDEFAGALKEAGFDPVIPDGGYLMLADSSSIVPDVVFDENGESYDFQFVKWMTKEKGVTAIPPSAFYSPGNSHLSGKLIRFCFCKKPETLQAAYSKLRKWKQERN